MCSSMVAYLMYSSSSQSTCDFPYSDQHPVGVLGTRGERSGGSGSGNRSGCAFPRVALERNKAYPSVQTGKQASFVLLLCKSGLLVAT